MARAVSPSTSPFHPLTADTRNPYGPSLIVVIGQGFREATFNVSETMICFYSGWFRLMSADYILDAPSSGGQIRLPGEDPDIFVVVLNYLFHRCWTTDGADPVRNFNWDNLTDIWSFGERRTMPAVGTCVLMRQMSPELP